MRRVLRSSRGGGDGAPAPSLAALGADLKYHWEVDADHVDLNGSNVLQLDERVGVAHATQATPDNQPAYTVGGGPNGTDCITLQDTDRRLNATISAAAGNRYGIYTVTSITATGGRVPTEIGAGAATIAAFGFRNNVLPLFEGYADFTGGAQSAIVVTSPVFDTGFHLHAFRPLVGGADYEIDGTAVITNFIGNDTMKAYDTFRVGYVNASLPAGAFCCCVIVDTPDDTKDQIIKDYIVAVYGLPIA